MKLAQQVYRIPKNDSPDFTSGMILFNITAKDNHNRDKVSDLFNAQQEFNGFVNSKEKFSKEMGELTKALVDSDYRRDRAGENSTFMLFEDDFRKLRKGEQLYKEIQAELTKNSDKFSKNIFDEINNEVASALKGLQNINKTLEPYTVERKRAVGRG